MFNIVKWAYKRGVENERQRIAMALQDKMRESIRNQFAFSKDHKDNEADIEYSVGQIIKSILSPSIYSEELYSIMHPKEDK